MLTSQTIGIKNGEMWISMRTGELFLTKGNLEAWKTKAIDIHSASVSESKCFLYTGFRGLELPDIGKPRLPFFKFPGDIPSLPSTLRCLERATTRQCHCQAVQGKGGKWRSN